MLIRWPRDHTLRSGVIDLNISMDTDKQMFDQEVEESKVAGDWHYLGRRRVYRDHSLGTLSPQSFELKRLTCPGSLLPSPIVFPFYEKPASQSTY